MSQSLEDRVIELETTVALQDRALEKLQESILAQQRLIDALEAGMAALGDRLRMALEPAGEEGDPLPPHSIQR